MRIEFPDCRVVITPRNDVVNLPHARHCERSEAISLFRAQ